jgi:hypothetical protein
MTNQLSNKAKKLLAEFSNAVFDEGMMSTSYNDDTVSQKARSAQNKLEKYIRELEIAVEYATRR